MGGRIGARMGGLDGNNDGRPRNVSDEDDPQIEDEDLPDNSGTNKVSREPEREPSKDPKYLTQQEESGQINSSS